MPIFVDFPDPDQPGRFLDKSETFKTRREAIEYLKQWGGDEEGRVCLISGEEDEGDENETSGEEEEGEGSHG